MVHHQGPNLGQGLFRLPNRPTGSSPAFWLLFLPGPPVTLAPSPPALPTQHVRLSRPKLPVSSGAPSHHSTHHHHRSAAAQVHRTTSSPTALLPLFPSSSTTSPTTLPPARPPNHCTMGVSGLLASQSNYHFLPFGRSAAAPGLAAGRSSAGHRTGGGEVCHATNTTSMQHSTTNL